MVNPVLFVAFSLFLTFAGVMSNEPNVANCPKIYQRFSTTHTYCQPQNQTCHILERKVPDAKTGMILDLHNKYRSIIATQGQESNGLPPASDMMFMEWDKELAAVAQKNVDRCIYDHDTADERRVRNFDVGQNLARQEVTGAEEKPQPDWEWAVSAWYGEIKDFQKSMICGSRDVPEEREIGHFTQVIWAKSFRVGCGYVLHKEGNTFVRLYACNYGPAGNIDGTCVYTEGRACSNCPANTACDNGNKYPGLCKRTGDQAPYVPIKQPTIFNCNFRDPQSEDCQIHSEGANKWSLIPALSGQFLETILQPGQNATIIFNKHIVGAEPQKKMCVQLRYRKGPEEAKNPQNNAGKAIFVIPESNDFTAPFNLPNYDGKFRQQFSAYSMTLGWISSTIMKLSFAVPNGAKPQFFDVEYVTAFNSPKCPKLEVF